MKKRVISFVALLSAVLLIGCDTNAKNAQEHLEHDWEEATCNSPKTCALCGEIEGANLEHDWEGATCNSLKTCVLCGKTEGKLSEHDWIEATCVSLKTCRYCGIETGKEAEHNLDNNGKCKVCSEQIGFQLNQSTYKKYLDISIDYDRKIRTDMYPVVFYSFNVEPLEAVKFCNVVLVYKVTLNDGQGCYNNYEREVYVNLSETGYASKNDVTFTGGKAIYYANRGYSGGRSNINNYEIPTIDRKCTLERIEGYIIK